MLARCKFLLISYVMVQSTAAFAITINNPIAGKVIDSRSPIIEVNGTCTVGVPVKIQATDSANNVTAQQRIGCETSGFSGQLNLTSLKDGPVKVRAYQALKRNTQTAYVTIQKTVAVVAPTPTPAPVVVSSVKITIPSANASFDLAHQIIEVGGNCLAGQPVRIESTDSVGAKTFQQWVMCESWGFSGPSDISLLRDGAIKIRAFQVINNVEQNSYQSVYKTTLASVPTMTPTPTPAPVVVAPAPAPSTSSKILWGVNGHDIRAVYPLSQSEAVFKMLASKNLRTYRVDITYNNTIILDTLIPLAKMYNIKLRPMFYPMTQAQAYAIGMKYGRDLEIVEIGNELSLAGRTGAQDRINTMVETYKGLKQAEAELGIKIKTSITTSHCNTDDPNGRCYHDANGDMWFTDMAKASGFNFDVITFHYYPWYGNKGYWFDMYLTQMRAMATKYSVPIYFNEANCAEVFRNVWDGGYPGDRGCYDGMTDLFVELTTKYADIVQEVNMYELFDQPYIGSTDPEAHFGIMYDIAHPKPLLQLLTDWANK